MLSTSAPVWTRLLVATLACALLLPAAGAGPAPTCHGAAGGFLLADGCEAWTATFDQGGDDQANGMVVSPDGRLYVLSAAMYSPVGPEVHLQVYSSDGSPLWTASYQTNAIVSPSEIISARSLALSPDGDHIYVVGSTAVSVWTQLYLLSYASNGTLEWALVLEPGTTGTDVLVSEDGGTVYVTGSANRDLLAVAFDSQTGAEEWRATYDGQAHISSSSQESGFGLALSANDAALYVTGTSKSMSGIIDHVTLAYDTASGTQLWVTRFHSADAITGAALDAQGYAVVATVGGDLVYVHGTAGTRALDAATGAERWSASAAVCRAHLPRVVPDECRLALDASAGRLFALGYNDVAAYDAGTGRLLWRLPLHMGGDTNAVSRAMVLSPDGTRLYLATPAGKGYVSDATLDWTYETHSLDASSGRLVWRTTYGEHAGTRGIAISPDGGRVYVTGEYFPRTGGADVVTVAYDTKLGLENLPKFPQP